MEYCQLFDKKLKHFIESNQDLSQSDPLVALKELFEMQEFRLGQEEIIQSILSGQDTVAIMPTGGGKSLCYQLPAMMKEGLTVVISPLVALMNDQVRGLKNIGLPAICLHSGQSIEERKKNFREIQMSKRCLLYVSPERVQKEGFAPWIRKQNVNLFAVDESHCVSQWGHDFRPEYSQLSQLKKWCPNVPMIALTATATPYVIDDIIECLGLQDPVRHVYGFYRPNLYYQVEFCVDEDEKESFLLQALEQTPEGRVIIYCGTRRKAEEWAGQLSRQKAFNGQVGYYHAGLSAEDRNDIEKEYARGDIRILAATNAFGMGIDHPDVRLVVHTQMPGNVESYYQEVGRAGRDGKDSTCLLLYSKKDKGLHSYFIRESGADGKIKTHRWAALDAMVNYAEGGECRHGDILTYFKDQKRIQRCGHCDSCDPQSERKIKRRPRLGIAKKSKSKRRGQVTALEGLSDEAKWRMDLLKTWRKEYAKEQDMPAFLVFSDKTLRDLADKAPHNARGLKDIHGLGEKKIELFGDKLIQLLHPE